MIPAFLCSMKVTETMFQTVLTRARARLTIAVVATGILLANATIGLTGARAARARAADQSPLALRLRSRRSEFRPVPYGHAHRARRRDKSAVIRHRGHKGVTISGRVVDTQGKPIAGAEVVDSTAGLSFLT